MKWLESTVSHVQCCAKVLGTKKKKIKKKKSNYEIKRVTKISKNIATLHFYTAAQIQKTRKMDIFETIFWSKIA